VPALHWMVQFLVRRICVAKLRRQFALVLERYLFYDGWLAGVCLSDALCKGYGRRLRSIMEEATAHLCIF
jgi:hypothetical protein